MSVYIAMGFSYRINIVWGGGVFILIPATGKGQELEIPKNVRVFQVLLAGIEGRVYRKEESTLIKCFCYWKQNTYRCFSKKHHFAIT